MALDSLSSIKTAALVGLDREDLSSYADDFITLAEDLFNNGGEVGSMGAMPPVRHRKMEATTSLTPSSNVCTLPSDYLHYIRVVEEASTRRELRFKTPSAIDQLYPSQTAGVSQHFTIVGSSLTAYPLSTNDIELTYYQKIPTLIDNDPNWLLTEAPSAYLRGIQLQALIFINELDTPRFTSILAALKMAVSGLNSQSELGKYYSAGVTMSGSTP